MTGAFISRTTTTDAAGNYQFDNLMPGTYIVFQPTQPPKYKDGLDTLGNTFNGAGVMQAPNGLVAPDQNADDNRDAEAFEGIVLQERLRGQGLQLRRAGRDDEQARLRAADGLAISPAERQPAAALQPTRPQRIRRG